MKWDLKKAPTSSSIHRMQNDLSCEKENDLNLLQKSEI